MEKIPDYRIREEEDNETEESLKVLRERLREHRLRKVVQYKAKVSPLGETEQESGVKLSQTCHDRAHTESVPQPGEEAAQDPPPSLPPAPPPHYQFPDPCPGSMRHVRIEELSGGGMVKHLMKTNNDIIIIS